MAYELAEPIKVSLHSVPHQETAGHWPEERGNIDSVDLSLGRQDVGVWMCVVTSP